jgi:hypothetical protein
MDDQILPAISATLAALDKATSWAFVALLATAISGLQQDKKIKIGGFEIDGKYASNVTFAILCGINFITLRLLQNLVFFFDVAGSKTEQAKFLINSNPWVFNPFAETSGFLSYVTDNLGLALLLLLWWLGFHTGFFLHRGAKQVWISNILSIIYLLLGLTSMVLIMMFMAKVNSGTAIIKIALLFIAIPFGAGGLRVLFRTKPVR